MKTANQGVIEVCKAANYIPSFGCLMLLTLYIPCWYIPTITYPTYTLQDENKHRV